MPKPKSRKKKTPKRVLALPDLEHAKTAVLNSLTSASGQRTYDHAIREFVAWYCSEPRLAFNRSVVLRYRIHLEQRHYAPATINLRLAAVRRIAYEAADAGLLSPELAAGIRRVKGVRRLGVRLGNWLTPEQGRRLLEHSTPSAYAFRLAVTSSCSSHDARSSCTRPDIWPSSWIPSNTHPPSWRFDIASTARATNAKTSGSPRGPAALNSTPRVSRPPLSSSRN